MSAYLHLGDAAFIVFAIAALIFTLVVLLLAPLLFRS